MNIQAASKIKMLIGSLRWFVFGLISLITLIGVPFAILAVASRGDDSGFSGFCFFLSALSLAGFPFAAATIAVSMKVRADEKRFWNAARPYRILGDVCAGFAVIASFVIGALVVFFILNSNLFGTAF